LFNTLNLITMPYGTGTYGSKKGRPSKAAKKTARKAKRATRKAKRATKKAARKMKK
jgi:hypothetical protein